MKRSSRLVLLGLLAILAFSCKKYIQQQEQNEATSIITDGYWYVSGFEQNNSDITALFSGYLFKFNTNNTVTGTNSSLTYAGNWSDNIPARTITTDFPGAASPITYLNETWTITDSYTDSVSAKSTDTVLHTSNLLQLKKQ
jgi:hypothetical protein